MRLLHSLTIGILTLSPAACVASAQRGPPPAIAEPVAAPGVSDRTQLWLSRRTLRRGEPATVNFRTTEDAFVSVIRVTTDGRFEVLYPARPHDDAFVRGWRTVVARAPLTSYSFRAHEPAGTGWIFAITSGEPFDFREFSTGRQWSLRLGHLAGHDPFLAAEEFAERIVHPRAWYALEYERYYVDRHSASWPAVVVYDRYSVWYPYRRVRCYDSGLYGAAYYTYRGGYYDCEYRYYGGGEVYVRRPRLIAKDDAPGARTPEEAIGRRRRADVVDDSRPRASPDDAGAATRRRPVAGDAPPAGRPWPGEDDELPPGERGRRRGHESDGPGSSDSAPGPRRRQAADSPGDSDDAPAPRASAEPRRESAGRAAPKAAQRGSRTEPSAAKPAKASGETRPAARSAGTEREREQRRPEPKRRP